MTPEQNEQWRNAIDPLEYLDFYAMEAAGLAEFARRLGDRGVPGWAIELRRVCVAAGWQQHRDWALTFALNSETALTGMQIRYPLPDERVDAYRRVLLRLFHELLKPVTLWAASCESEVQRACQEALDRMHRFCEGERLYVPIQEAEWFDAQHRVSEAYHAAMASCSEAPASFPDYRGQLGVLKLVRTLFTNWQAVLLRPSEYDSWWKSSRSRAVSDLASRLSECYSGCGIAAAVEAEEAENEAIPTEFLALAYLSALEAECPPPDWMYSQ